MIESMVQTDSAPLWTQLNDEIDNHLFQNERASEDSHLSNANVSNDSLTDGLNEWAIRNATNVSETQSQSM